MSTAYLLTYLNFYDVLRNRHTKPCSAVRGGILDVRDLRDDYATHYVHPDPAFIQPGKSA